MFLRFLTVFSLVLTVSLSVFPLTPAGAVEADEVLKDPKLEARARAISAGLRCLVCQNQSIDDSNAPLAKDLRLLVRERLKAGDSDEEVVNYVVSRYGEFVLLKPKFGWHTLLLWVGPVLLLVLAIIGIIVAYRRYGQAQAAVAGPPPLSEAEKKRLADLLRQDET